MASMKSMLAASILAAPADAFVVPGSQSSQVSGLRGTTSASSASGSSFGTFSMLAASGVSGAAMVSFARPRKAKVVCNFSKESQIGAMEPLGFFDPAGFCTDEAAFKDLRAKEIKHGRLAMMGALGMLTQSLVTLPGMEGVPKDVTACTVGNGQVGFLLTIGIIAVLEATVFVQDESKEPGNFGNPVPWFDDYSDEMRARSQSSQVSGLRGTTSASSASGSSFGTFSMLAASGVSGAAMVSFARPRKAKVVCNFSKESQIGAMEPLGFFDPAGFCTDEAAFKDLRAKEIKHGVPKDVTACTVGNGQVGFLLTIGIIAVLEATVFVQDESKEPGNFGNPVPWFDDYSDEMRARSQSSQVSGLRGTTSASSASGSSFGTFSMLAASGVSGAAMVSFARPRKAKVVCNFSKESQIGAMEPLGFFDPAGFCTDEAAFKDLRAKEIKHGRLAMMGALGMLTQSLVTLPGMEGVPKDVTACTVGNGQVGFLLTIGIIAVLEATVFVQDESKEPGNFGNPVPWFDDYSDEMRARSQSSQVSGLRGTTSASSASGSSFGTFSMLAASGVSGAAMVSFARPRKAKVVCNFSKESQIGAMEPLGFFDPAGFCTDEAAFKDLRAKEIKHGRLAMMGALGMLTQSLVTLPGMEGVPKDVTACTVGNGQVGFLLTIGIIAVLEATVFVQDESKVSGLRGTTSASSASGSSFGTFSMLAASGVSGAAMVSFARPRKAKVVCNFSKESQIGAMEPLGFFDPAGFCTDEAAFKDLRAKEIKHGRLAMMGALGMLTQSLVTLPGMEGVPKDVTACTVGNGQVGFLLTIGIIAVLEATVFVQDESKEPGNFGNPVPWFDDYSDEMRARELNNGRIAMFSAIGQIAAGLYTGKAGIEQFGV
ncbi:unnamed protein product [Effrenium voratum]|nr:unnamed protein product [Effrenium voratum]